MFASYPINFDERSNEAELIDGSDYSSDEFIDNLSDLRRVNRYLGGQNALTRHLFPMIEALGQERVRLLDVGTGSADIPTKIVQWSRARGIKVQFVALDYNELAAREASRMTVRYPEIQVVRADALNLPFAPQSFDFVLASLFLHHFETPQAVNLIRSFAGVARAGFIINDLRRHPVAYYAIKVLTRIFTRNRLVRNDAAVSVLRGFTEDEIEGIASESQTRMRIYRHFPYRFILIGNHDRTRSPENL
ncbi:MAG TPA: methyltransferase domain-containing protein [Blastocatellia bacterium]|nr:methyltransferase domain-containing protein [Blastocatellia bacterium]